MSFLAVPMCFASFYGAVDPFSLYDPHPVATTILRHLYVHAQRFYRCTHGTPNLNTIQTVNWYDRNNDLLKM